MFYIGRKDLAIPQLVFGLIPSLALYIAACLSFMGVTVGIFGMIAAICSCSEDFVESFMNMFSAGSTICGIITAVIACVVTPFAIAAFIMWLVCWITILTGEMHDGHGNALHNSLFV